MKKLILIICFIFLTGCKAEYNLVYENDKISESLNVVSNHEQSFKDLVNEYYNNLVLIVDYEIDTGDMNNSEIISKYPTYNKSIISNDLYGLQLGYIYNLQNDYKNSSIVHGLFNKFSVSDNYFKAYDIKDIFSNYPELEEIDITFKTDKIIESSNADSVKNGIYYWNINKDNYKDKVININFDNSVNKTVITINNNRNLIYIILGILGIGLLITIVVIYEKVRKSNK